MIKTIQGHTTAAVTKDEIYIGARKITCSSTWQKPEVFRRSQEIFPVRKFRILADDKCFTAATNTCCLCVFSQNIFCYNITLIIFERLCWAESKTTYCKGCVVGKHRNNLNRHDSHSVFAAVLDTAEFTTGTWIFFFLILLLLQT